MSLGPQQVLKAKQVIVIVSWEKKRSLVSELASFDHYDPEFPLSIIHDIDVAPRVSVYLTEDIGDAWPRTPQI
jgi:6-phosphogluconolactonase/glucosamine-6-phosphate isomerase/deaminase